MLSFSHWGMFDDGTEAALDAQLLEEMRFLALMDYVRTARDHIQQSIQQIELMGWVPTDRVLN